MKEIVYKGRDNTIELQLLSDGAAIDHTGITRVVVDFGTPEIDSNTSPTLFDLTNSDRIILKFGGSTLQVGDYWAQLYIYDAVATNGLVWGEPFSVEVR